jgi:hypothetical protein
MSFEQAAAQQQGRHTWGDVVTTLVAVSNISLNLNDWRLGCSVDLGWAEKRGYRKCAGLNRHVLGNERILQERRERIHLGPEFCGGHREVSVEA